jgi:hypothetical protein
MRECKLYRKISGYFMCGKEPIEYFAALHPMCIVSCCYILLLRQSFWMSILQSCRRSCRTLQAHYVLLLCLSWHFVSTQVNHTTTWLRAYLWRGGLWYTQSRSSLDVVDGRYSRLSSCYLPIAYFLYLQLLSFRPLFYYSFLLPYFCSHSMDEAISHLSLNGPSSIPG